MLPTAMTMAEKPSLNKLTWMIYGAPGIGKSTLFSKFPNALFLYTDPGLTFISALKQPINKWTEFKDALKELVAQPKPAYGIIVVDTIDVLWTQCVEYVCRARGIEHESDEQWGKAYAIIEREFKIPIQQLCMLKSRGCGVAFISHATEIEVRGRIIKTSKVVPTLNKKARSIVMPLCDVIGYCGFSLNTKQDIDLASPRYLFFKPDETLEAKDRTTILPEKCLLDIEVLKKCFTGTTPVKTPVHANVGGPKKIIRKVQ
jgi:GTPase SAR1 family protein